MKQYIKPSATVREVKVEPFMNLSVGGDPYDPSKALGPGFRQMQDPFETTLETQFTGFFAL